MYPIRLRKSWHININKRLTRRLISLTNSARKYIPQDTSQIFFAPSPRNASSTPSRYIISTLPYTLFVVTVVNFTVFIYSGACDAFRSIRQQRRAKNSDSDCRSSGRESYFSSINMKFPTVRTFGWTT